MKRGYFGGNARRGKYKVFIKKNKANEESRYHRIIHPNIYAAVKALAKAEGISDEEAYDRIMYEAAHCKTI